MKLLFRLNHQSIERLDANKVVSDSKNYLTASFEDVSHDWQQPITAIFSNDTQSFTVLLDEKNECSVPWELLQEAGLFKVSAFCSDLHTADEVSIRVYPSGYKAGETPSEPTPSVYDQLTKSVEQAVKTANSVRSDADAGLFKGDKGDKGDQGVPGVKGDTGATGAQGAQGIPGNDGYSPVRGVDYWTAEDQQPIIDATNVANAAATEAHIASMGTPKGTFAELNLSEQEIIRPVMTKGQYINLQGKKVRNGNNQLATTDYIQIPVETYGLEITVDEFAPQISYAVSFYDIDKTFISGMNALIFSDNNIPQNAVYIRLNNYDVSLNHENVTYKFKVFKRFDNIESNVDNLTTNLKTCQGTIIDIWKNKDEYFPNTYWVPNRETKHRTHHEGFNTSGFIPIIPGDYRMIVVDRDYAYGSFLHAVPNAVYYDENKSFISYENLQAVSKKYITVPDGAAYLVFSVNDRAKNYPAENIIITPGSDPYLPLDKKIFSDTMPYTSLFGKKWLCFGDSITNKNFRTTANYHDFIRSETGCVVVNKAISGAGYSDVYQDNAIYNQIENYQEETPDFITIMAGINDVMFSDLPVGDITDSGTTSLMCYVNKAVHDIREKFPYTLFGLMSPIPMKDYPPSNTNKLGQFVDKLNEYCRANGIPFLDQYHYCFLRPWESEQSKKFFSCDSVPNGDGLHPNFFGHEIMARKILEFLKTFV